MLQEKKRKKRKKKRGRKKERENLNVLKNLFFIFFEIIV
jgi:hypothetical protein